MEPPFIEHDVAATGEACRKRPALHHANGDADGDEARAARRIGRKGGALHAQMIRDTTRNDPDAPGGDRVGRQRLHQGPEVDQRLVLACRRTDKHPSTIKCMLSTRTPRRRIENQLCDRLEHEALLRVHELAFPGGEAPRRGIERFDRLEKSTEADSMDAIYLVFHVPPLERDGHDGVIGERVDRCRCRRRRRSTAWEQVLRANDRHGRPLV